MNDEIRREIRRQTRFLRGYALLMTAAAGVMALGAFQACALPTRSTLAQPQEKTKFTEIDVERINIVEPNGNLRMVLSNRPRSIGPIYKNKPFGYAGGTRPGLIFFNDEGTENGGFTFTGSRNANGRYQATTHLAFDQFDQDQILMLQYSDNNGVRRTGFTVQDRAERNIYDLVLARDSIRAMADTVARNAALAKLMGPENGIPLAATRLYVGRDQQKSAIINLSDRTGAVRMRMRVDSLGRASLDFLDATGRVTYSLPDSARR